MGCVQCTFLLFVQRQSQVYHLFRVQRLCALYCSLRERESEIQHEFLFSNHRLRVEGVENIWIWLFQTSVHFFFFFFIDFSFFFYFISHLLLSSRQRTGNATRSISGRINPPPRPLHRRHLHMHYDWKNHFLKNRKQQ